MRQSLTYRLLGAAIALIVISGCATNALRVEYAGDVGTKGRAAAAASREYLKEVEAARLEANLDLVEQDPACGRWQPALRRQVSLGPDKPAVGWLCAAGSDVPGSPFSLRPISYQLVPTIQLTDALTSYADALIEVAQGDRVSPAQGFIDALATARSVQRLAGAVTNSEVGPSLAADDPRVVAATGFVNFLGELAEEAGRVEDLRQIIARNPEGARPLIRALRDHLVTWEISRKSDRATELLIEAALLSSVFNAQPPAEGSARRTALDNYYRRDAERLAGDQLHPKLDALLHALEQADADLRRVLEPNPNLTDEERRRVAEISRKRIVRALDGLTEIINAVRGG